MSKVTYLTEVAHTVIDIEPGTSLMAAAVANAIDGIFGECGGNAMCATCHVFVEEGPFTALPPISDAEEEMLDCTAAPRRPNSRLSCQIPATSELDGLVVRIAEEQL
ncbi:2Fe-2S iron-sulfur cluster-binding protein [Nocardioides daejeonensis]|uniref:2Fe-2S iron-sulfur cluster-binding protein n=1 Tax=Nocardioides daejeonensis TaxID=1046556 RepID=UPI000D740BD1|nr:2Fe-2S iron-sulfur cluster-binding protein [Nocardioides daejeonensis]